MEMTPARSAAAANHKPRTEREEEARRGHWDLPKHRLGQAAGGTQHKAEALDGAATDRAAAREEAAGALRCLCSSLAPLGSPLGSAAPAALQPRGLAELRRTCTGEPSLLDQHRASNKDLSHSLWGFYQETSTLSWHPG